jgi:exodeoxyribonuclease V beta subunit
METFDITGPLPTGTTLLEASAGTGKTWTISALVTRYVAEGVASLDQLLVVTFTRAASQELRDRVRTALRDAADVLADPTTAREGDALHGWLLAAPAADRALRLRRLLEALASFDAATIATIHQFCQLVLRSLGVAGDSDDGAVQVEDLDQLADEVIDDLYLARFAHEAERPWTRAEAGVLARAVIDDPRAVVEPVEALSGAPDSTAAQRVRFADDVLDEIERRKRRLGILSYDDLLGQLADALSEQDAPARVRMRQRWQVVLIDEFQDTDPVQWQVFSRAFHGVATMVLIGDPKQAIYAFRGGDVTTYLRAAEAATTRQTLAVNHRTDGDLLARLQVVLEQAELGDERIVVHPVRAQHPGSRLSPSMGSPFQLRQVREADIGWRSGRRKAPVARWREHVSADVAREIKRTLLDEDACLDGKRVEAGDIAVLAARRAQLEAIQVELTRLGVPSVVNAGGSVFSTPAAAEWVTLLEALEQPHRTDRVRAAALTSFLGLSATDLDARGDRGTDDLAERVRTLSAILAARGVAAVLEWTVVAGMTERVLGRVGGERDLTDLRHIGEALHKVSVQERLGATGLLAWLRDQVRDDKHEVASERTRRLDSDAAAVQLVTIHGSKGLEYPVVHLPSLWDRYLRDPDVPLFHDDEGRRCRDVGGRSPWQRDHLARHHREDAGESMRLLYVAMTRARSQVVAWYAPADRNTPASPLHRMLFGRRPGTPGVPDQQALVPDDRATEILGYWQQAGAFEPLLAAPSPLPDRALARAEQVLETRAFTREVDTTWRRTSYSSLSAAAPPPPRAAPPPAGPGGAPGGAPAPGAGAREPADGDDGDGAGPADLELADVPSPMADLPVGAAFGSLVHAVLEHADPDATDFREELLTHIAEQRGWWPVEVDSEALADALVTVCVSPLGPLAGDLTLMEVPVADRLRELDFELPLCGGDDASYDVDEVRLGDLAPLLRRHLGEDDPLLAYADTLDGDATLGAQPLRGYLTGSIDVVMRVRGEHGDRFLTVDYKTNWLGDLAAPLSARDYRPEVLADAMGHSDYPLQALLYTVVLHRYLRWRLPGYDPATHLGGVLYLYLRGMCGAGTPVVDKEPCGVFSWRPPVGLVEDLSALLDGDLVSLAGHGGGGGGMVR